MKSQYLPCCKQPSLNQQRGVVLFFALIALVVMSLAAVALIRSVDTSSLIAGNLAFKQSTTSSGDTGIEAAIAALTQMQANGNSDPLINGAHPFNTTVPSNGYYSYFDPNLNVIDGINWTNADSADAGTDGSGNGIRYIIQRMCRTNTPNLPASSAGCLPSGAVIDTNGKEIKAGPEFCKTCPAPNSPTQIRITVQIKGSKNTVSYLQAFVY